MANVAGWSEISPPNRAGVEWFSRLLSATRYVEGVATLLREGDIDAARRVVVPYLAKHCRQHALVRTDVSNEEREVPLWTGRPVRRLAAITMEGDGDALQYARFLTAARKRCSHLVCVTVDRLVRTFRRCAPADEVVPFSRLDHALREADAFVSIGLDLMLVAADGREGPFRVDAPADRTPIVDHSRTNVGLCWAQGHAGLDRSIQFPALRPLLNMGGITFHSLQVGAAANDHGGELRSHAIADYDDTAALIAAMDAIVTVDTSVAHLAATMGAPTHLLLPEGPCQRADARWGDGDRHTRLYPSARLYRGAREAIVADVCLAIRGNGR